MLYLLLLASVVLAVVKSAFVKQYSVCAPDRNSRIFFFNLVAFGLAALAQTILLLVTEGLPNLSLWTILPAAGYAVSCYLMQLFLMKSMASGPMGLSSLFCMYGLIIPAVAGPIFFGESFSIWKGLGVILMLLAIFFSVDLKSEKSETPKKWFVYALLTLCFSGMVGVFEKIHQTGPDKAEIPTFLSCAFLFIFLLNLVTFPIAKAKETTPVSYKSGLLFAFLTGLVIIFYNRINLTLAGRLPTMIYYPISSGGAVLLTLIVSILIFREPVKRRSALCFAFGTAAILLLGLF